MTWNPGGVGARARFPMARRPDPMILHKVPVAMHPDIRFTRRRAFDFHARSRRFLRHRNGASSGCLRCCYCGVSHFRVVRDASSYQKPAAHDQRQNAKRQFSFHNFLKAWPAQPSRVLWIHQWLKKHILGSGSGQVGKFATLARGEFRPRSADPASFALEVFGGAVIFVTCRFTSFTARNAGRTAKSWSVRAIGGAQNARSAARPSSRRNFRCLPRPMPAAAEALHPNAPAVAAGQAADVTEGALKR